MTTPKLVVHPRLSNTPGSLAVFIADLYQPALRSVTFTLNGAAAQPRALRALKAVRNAALGVPVGSNFSRAFTGVYQFMGLTPGTLYRVGVTVGGQTRLLNISTLPDSVPNASDGGFDILLASCFCRYEAKPGAMQKALSNLLSALPAKSKNRPRAPDCSLFMGDQVYLDLPTLADFPDETRWLASRFEADYAENWSSYLDPFFQVAPSACLPDDHEYWNNAPHWASLISNSWSKEGRARWTAAAQACFDAFAQPLDAPGPIPLGTPYVFDVHPLSFFMADGRSARDFGKAFTLTPDCRAQLAQWVKNLNNTGRVGVFLTGQSLIRDRASGLTGKVADYELPNYGDYQEILNTLGTARQRIVLLTGDLHWSRVATGTDSAQRERVQEVVVSPLTLVSMPGADQIFSVAALLSRNPWPRHNAAQTPPSALKFGNGTSSFGLARTSSGQPAAMAGDHLALLSFNWTNGRLRASVRYFPVHHTLDSGVTVPLFDIALS